MRRCDIWQSPILKTCQREPSIITGVFETTYLLLIMLNHVDQVLAYHCNLNPLQAAYCCRNS